MAVSRTSAQNARTRALADCSNQAQQCRIVQDFKNTCVATAIFYDRQLEIGTGSTLQQANDQAMKACTAKGTACRAGFASCDPPDAAAPTEPVLPRVTQQTQTTTIARPTVAQEQSGSWAWLWLPVFAAAGYLAYRYRGQLQQLWKPKQQQIVANSFPDSHDTEQAQNHMRAAQDHIAKGIGASKAINIKASNVEEILSSLNSAAEHLTKAYVLDPHAMIEDEQGETFNQSTLSGMVLYMEGACEIQLARKSPLAFFGRRHLKRAIAAFTLAVEQTSFPIYERDLAEAYALLGDQVNARVHITRAFDLDPNNVSIVQLQNDIGKINELHPSPPFFELKVGLFVLAAALTALALIALLIGADTPTLYLLGFAPWLVFVAYLAARNQLRKRLGAMWWTYTHYKNEKREKKLKDFIHLLHQKREEGIKWRNI
jgi:tetratricopeptide (TPR) repeat protein